MLQWVEASFLPFRRGAPQAGDFEPRGVGEEGLVPAAVERQVALQDLAAESQLLGKRADEGGGQGKYKRSQLIQLGLVII